MIARLTQLIVAVAVMLMPFGMGHAAAAPAAGRGSHSSAMTGAAMNHCPDRSSRSAKGLAGECTMACAAALPAAPMAADAGPLPYVMRHGLPMISARLFGLVLEIATPPPRSA